MITSVKELIASVEGDELPPKELSQDLKALWLAKKGRWNQAHDVAQEIETKMGYWIHALLHVIEGDQWNAGYWFSRAEKPEKGPAEIDNEWLAIAESAFDRSG